MRRARSLNAAAALAVAALVTVGSTAAAPMPPPPDLVPWARDTRKRRRGSAYSAKLNAWAQKRGRKP